MCLVSLFLFRKQRVCFLVASATSSWQGENGITSYFYDEFLVVVDYNEFHNFSLDLNVRFNS